MHTTHNTHTYPPLKNVNSVMLLSVPPRSHTRQHFTAPPRRMKRGRLDAFLLCKPAGRWRGGGGLVATCALGGAAPAINASRACAEAFAVRSAAGGGGAGAHRRRAALPRCPGPSGCLRVGFVSCHARSCSQGGLRQDSATQNCVATPQAGTQRAVTAPDSHWGTPYSLVSSEPGVGPPAQHASRDATGIWRSQRQCARPKRC